MAAGIPAAVATIAGSVIGSRANDKATATTNSYNQQALEYQKQKDAQDRADAQKLLDLQAAQYAANQARRAPYYAAAQALLGQNSNRLGLGTLPMWTGSSQPAVGSSSQVASAGSSPTLSSLAGIPTNSAPQAVQAPQLSLSDVLNGSWTGRG